MNETILHPLCDEFRLAEYNASEQCDVTVFASGKIGKVSGDDVVREDPQSVHVTTRGEVLECSDAHVTEGHPRQNGARKNFFAEDLIPSRDDWKLIIQKSAGQTAEYDPKHDVARVDLRRQSLTEPVESLTMWLIPSSAPGKARGELRLAWGRTVVSTDWSVK